MGRDKSIPIERVVIQHIGLKDTYNRVCDIEEYKDPKEGRTRYIYNSPIGMYTCKKTVLRIPMYSMT